MASTESAPTEQSRYLQENISQPLVAAVIAFIVLETIATVLRFWSRHLQRTPRPRGDILMLLSWLANLGVCTNVLLCVRFGAGQHMLALSQEDLVNYAKTAFIGLPLLYLIAVILPKLAILDLYLHILIHRFYRLTCYACGLVLILNCLVEWPLVFAVCVPFRKIWNLDAQGHCFNIRVLYAWASLPNIITDVVMLVVPIPTIAKLQQNWKVKLGIMLTFIVGGLGLITSMFRFVEFYRMGFAKDASDQTFKSLSLLLWSVVEPGAYHIAACLIEHRALVRWLVHESPPALALSRVFLLVSTKKFGEHCSTSDVSKIAPMKQGIGKESKIRSGAEVRRVETQDALSGKIPQRYIAHVAARSDIEQGYETMLPTEHQRGLINVSKTIEIHDEPA